MTSLGFSTAVENRSKNETVRASIGKELNLKQNRFGYCFKPRTSFCFTGLFQKSDLESEEVS